MINKIRKLCAIVVAFLSALAIVGAVLMSHIHSFYDSQARDKKDYIVVFGAAVAPGAKATPALYDRAKSAAMLYAKGMASRVILSGAPSVFGAHEVDVMRDIMLEEGVDVRDLIFDFDGLNTKQTIENLDKTKSYILVSNDFHLARINLFAKRAGLEDFALFASHYNSGRPNNELYWVAREMVAVIYYFFATM